VPKPSAQQPYPLRRADLRELLIQSKVDALLVTDLVNIRYLTGFTGSNAALLVRADSSSAGGEDGTVFCTDGRYTLQAEIQVPDLERVIDRDSAAALVGLINRHPQRYRLTGCESRHMNIEDYYLLSELAQGWELRRSPDLVEKLRQVKDESEIRAIRSACSIADRALEELIGRGAVRAGRTERQVARELEYLMRDFGSEGLAFESIVATGANTAIPHHEPDETVLSQGDFFTLDFGATIAGYRSDMTRTIVIGRDGQDRPEHWQRDLYELVYQAQAAGRRALLPDQKVGELYSIVRGVIDEAGYGAEFPHGLGHGIGLETHEAPLMLRATSLGTLSAGMAVTVEPGVYLAGRGGVRIEDTLVVRDEAPELLTLSSKELLVVH
jgi:Xaa-Pro aminopeptidase